MKEENKECCKWCTHCFIYDLEKGTGKCCVDIGDRINDINNECCCDYRYDGDLDRC